MWGRVPRLGCFPSGAENCTMHWPSKSAWHRNETCTFEDWYWHAYRETSEQTGRHHPSCMLHLSMEQSRALYSQTHLHMVRVWGWLNKVNSSFCLATESFGVRVDSHESSSFRFSALTQACLAPPGGWAPGEVKLLPRSSPRSAVATAIQRGRVCRALAEFCVV